MSIRAVKILLTGATGYVGGEVLSQLSGLPTRHAIRCLVRDDQKARLVVKACPNVEIVKGDLDDAELLEREARNADVVFHLASTKHEASSKAIARGLSRTDRQKPGYWIQISGASMFASSEVEAGVYGEPPSKTYDDVQDLEEIRSVIFANPARVVDQLVLSQDAARIKTALVPGPLFYGKGNGPGNTRSIQSPELARVTIERGEGFTVGRGLNSWSNVHIRDLGQLFLLLLHAAIEERDGLWNVNGVYFPENGSMSLMQTFAKLSDHIAEAVHYQGLTKSRKVESVPAKVADDMIGHASVLMGTNANLRSSRARKELAWSPVGPDLASEIPEVVREEALRLQKTKLSQRAQSKLVV